MNRYIIRPTYSGAQAALLEVSVQGGEDKYSPSNAINTTRKMYKDPMTFRSPMFDRRIVRGSTLVRRADTTNSRETQARRRELERRREQERRSQAVRTRARMGCEPPAVKRREQEPVDLAKHLEEILENEPEVETAECLTDMFLDRPQSPAYVPAKTGLDAETQIQPEDIWDYDLEVWPILEVLVGKTTEQALIEVVEEEELATILEHQRWFLERRKAEEAEKLRLEEEERRLREEKERRIREFHTAMAMQREAEERVAAAVFAHGYVADLLPDVLEGLKLAGYLLDDLRDFVEMDFVPGLMDDVEQTLRNRTTVDDILTTIVREIQETNAVIYRELGEAASPASLCIPMDTEESDKDRKPSETWTTEIRNMELEVSDQTTKLIEQPVMGRRLVSGVGGYSLPHPPSGDTDPLEPPPSETETPPNEEQ